jgi:hypothetical protein
VEARTDISGCGSPETWLLYSRRGRCLHIEGEPRTRSAEDRAEADGQATELDCDAPPGPERSSSGRP